MTTSGQTVESRPTEAVLETALHHLLTVADSSAGNNGLREKLHSLEAKLSTGQLHLAVLGQMKRGKSSFINALMGNEILPTGVLPVTAVITEIRYGSSPDATIIYSTGGLREKVALGALADFITEAGNPGNKKQVASVEIAYPCPFLESGIVLIDTPGIGSTHVHNTRTTEDYLGNVDAGIFVLSVDPPITEVESHFLETIKEEIPKLFFVLNKTDLAEAEDAGNVLHFLEDELERLQMAAPEIFPLSARKALEENRQSGGSAAPSGLQAFERRLNAFLTLEKRQVLIRSVAQDALHIASTLKFVAAIGVRASAMDPEELSGKKRMLDGLLDRTDSEIDEMQILLRQRSADMIAHVEQGLTSQAVTQISEIQRRLKVFQTQHPKSSGRAFGTLLEEFLMTEVETFFRKLKMQEDAAVQKQLDALSARFVAQANEILRRIGEAAGALFRVPVGSLSIACSLRVESRLRYKVEPIFYSLDSFLLLLPRFLLRPIVFRKMHNYIPQLLDMNAGRTRYDYVERLQASLTKFESDLRGSIAMVTDGLKAALREPRSGAQQTETAALLDLSIGDCSRILQCVAIQSKEGNRL